MLRTIKPPWPTTCASFSASCRDWRTARTVNTGHGRLEIRDLVASTELNEFLGGQWAAVAQVVQVTRPVYEDGQMRREIVYGITSLSPTRASAARLLALVRAHWRRRSCVAFWVIPPMSTMRSAFSS